MEPDFYEGDYLLIRPLIKPQIGDVVVIKNENNLFLKKISDIRTSNYFVTGNHPDSIDSKTFGPIQRNMIIGKVLKRISKL